MKSITIFPPKMEAIGQALDLFGEDRVRTGEWNEPVTIRGLNDDEVAFASDYFGGLGFTVVVLNNSATRNSVRESIWPSQQAYA